jgi:hypothetical protein
VASSSYSAKPREGGEGVMVDKVPKERWLAAHEQEKKGIGTEKAGDIKEWLRVRRITWANLIDLLKGEIGFNNSTRILDIGSGPTSVFLAIRKGEKYAVDPNFERLFELHPFMREVEEYKEVNFISSPIEEIALDKQFDLIFAINVLDHVGELKPVIDKVDELLAASGMLVIIVDCYADAAVSKIMRSFDVDLPHPHHFVSEDIVRLFSSYKLIKQDSEIYKLTYKPPFRGQRGEIIEFYRLDKLAARGRQHLKEFRGGCVHPKIYLRLYPRFAPRLA